jgi:indole-3-pyruvate monooxygenase
MTKGLIYLGMRLLKWHLPVKLVDFIILTLANIQFGDLSRYGIVRPNMGPLLLKAKTGRSAVLDVGTTQLIKTGDIKVSARRTCAFSYIILSLHSFLFIAI